MLPAEFQDLTRLMEVTTDRWREVLVAAGASQRMNGTPFSHQSLLQSLRTSPPEDKLVDALETIFELGTDHGREALLSAADDRQVSLGAAEGVPAPELAARLWITGQSDSAVRDVLVRARVHAHGVAHARACREFVGKSGKSIRGLDDRLLLDAITRRLEELGQGEAIEVVTQEADGEWRCEVLRGDAAKRVIEIRERRAVVLNYQPAASDHLRYDPETGRLAISTRSPRRLQMYRQVMGTLLAGDPDFFAGENICSLKPLQMHGRELFERHQVPGIRHVTVDELRWRRGDRDKMWVRGHDCFKLLGEQLHEGELVEAKLSISFAGQIRRGHAVIKVPNRIDITAGMRQGLVEQLLDQVGIRGSFEDDERQEFWALYPWRLNDAAWRHYLGPEFDRLVRRGILRRTQLEAVTHPNHPAASGALAVQVVDENTIVGVSDDAALGVRTLTASDIEGYEPDCARVARELACALGLDENAVREVESGMWSLGRRKLSPSTTLGVFLALRRPSKAAATVARDGSHGAVPVLLVPCGCACALLQMTQIECNVPKGPYDELLGNIIERLGVQDDVNPTLWIHADLIVDEKRGIVWYKRTELTQLRADSHPFRFAVAIVRAAGEVVTKEKLVELLSPRSLDDSVARKAKKDFLDALEKSFRAQGLPCPPEAKNMFASSGGGYRLSGSARLR